MADCGIDITGREMIRLTQPARSLAFVSHPPFVFVAFLPYYQTTYAY